MTFADVPLLPSCFLNRGRATHIGRGHAIFEYSKIAKASTAFAKGCTGFDTLRVSRTLHNGTDLAVCSRLQTSLNGRVIHVFDLGFELCWGEGRGEADKHIMSLHRIFASQAVVFEVVFKWPEEPIAGNPLDFRGHS
jgi:hypothetical protein